MSDSRPNSGVRKTAVRWSSLVALLVLMISACGGPAENTASTDTADPLVKTTTTRGGSSTNSVPSGEQTSTSEATSGLATSVFALTLDTATGAWLAAGGAPTWSPDGSQIAFTAQAENGENAVYLISSTGGTGLFLASGTEPTWSPDGSQIAFTGE